MKRVVLCVLLLLALGLSPACQSTSKDSSGPYSMQEGTVRETARAERLTKEAADLMAANPAKAELLLREALDADLFFGPAHNNLGVLFLKRDYLYEAANEFEWARKLMPGHPDPRFNLAMTLEQAGQVDEALASYSAALEVYDGFLPAIQGLASLTLKSGRGDERMREWLEQIALRSTDPSWTTWAKHQVQMTIHRRAPEPDSRGGSY